MNTDTFKLNTQDTQAMEMIAKIDRNIPGFKQALLDKITDDLHNMKDSHRYSINADDFMASMLFEVSKAVSNVYNVHAPEQAKQEKGADVFNLFVNELMLPLVVVLNSAELINQELDQVSRALNVPKPDHITDQEMEKLRCMANLGALETTKGIYNGYTKQLTEFDEIAVGVRKLAARTYAKHLRNQVDKGEL